MSLNRLQALKNMGPELNTLLLETPATGKEQELLSQILPLLDELTYYIAVSVDGPDTKRRFLAFL